MNRLLSVRRFHQVPAARRPTLVGSPRSGTAGPRRQNNAASVRRGRARDGGGLRGPGRRTDLGDAALGLCRLRAPERDVSRPRHVRTELQRGRPRLRTRPHHRRARLPVDRGAARRSRRRCRAGLARKCLRHAAPQAQRSGATMSARVNTAKAAHAGERCRHRSVARAASRSGPPPDPRRDGLQRRHRGRGGKPAGVAGAAQGPRRPRADRAGAVARRRAAARRVHPRASDAAHHLELERLGRHRPARRFARDLHRDGDRRAPARAGGARRGRARSFPGCWSTSAAFSSGWKTSSASEAGRCARPRSCCSSASIGWRGTMACTAKRTARARPRSGRGWRTMPNSSSAPATGRDQFTAASACWRRGGCDRPSSGSRWSAAA